MEREEIWKDIEGYEGLYQVSDMGRVKSLKYGRTGQERVLKDSRGNNRGYRRIGFSKNRKQKSFWVHRLVAQAFIPNPENKPEVDHINTIPYDNRAENLRWVTATENCNNPLTLKHNSEAQKVVMMDMERRRRIGAKVSITNMGHPTSESTRRKISEAKKGKPFSEEHRQHLSEARKGRFSGSESPSAKAVVQFTIEGEKVREWGSIAEAGRVLGIQHNNITKVCKGERNKCGGYKWKYLEDVA